MRMNAIKLTDAEMSLVYSLVIHRKHEGSYAGNKDQYYKRVQSVLDKLESAYKNRKDLTK